MMNRNGMSEERVVEGIMAHGFARASFDSQQAFVEFARSLGEIMLSIDVTPFASVEGDNEISDEIPYHSDGAETDVIGWLCVKQDENAGQSVLVDTIPALLQLTPQQRSDLQTVNIPYNNRSFAGGPDRECEILRGNGPADWRVNYAPWMLPPMSDDQRAAVAAFDEALAKTKPTTMRLAEGDALFGDNWRLLHARAQLPSASRRVLRRLWLQTSRDSRLDPIAVGSPPPV